MSPLRALWLRVSTRRWFTPLAAVAAAIAMLAAATVLGIHNESVHRTEKFQQAQVQAEILAASLAAPLAFDDRAAADQYIAALRLDANVEAVAAYDVSGRRIAGVAQPGLGLPEEAKPAAPRIEGNDLVITVPVLQGGTRLGTVYLKTAMETWTRRAARYLGIALLVSMAALLIAVLGYSYASLSHAHRALREEIESRKSAEEQLRQAQKMEAMGQLTGGVAHDFNNLLMVASSGLDLMERTSDPAKRERLKDGIRQAVERGAKLTQQLLTFARRSPLHPEVIDIAERVRGMDAMLDRSLREDIIVRLDLAPELWPVEADPSQLEVAILNIALNARDAMADGGTITIVARNMPCALADRSDAVCLAISDTGAGLEPAMVEKVFEPFFTTKGVGHGTGLGLSQVYGFARASGGEVRFESELGKGSTVSLLMPRSLKPRPVTAAPATMPAVATSEERKVLLVEDDGNVADLVAQMLQELGFSVERSDSADAAIQHLRRTSDYDVVLSDMVMPGKLGGLDLAQEIRRGWPKLPVILMTGYSAAAASAANEGIRLLVKPYRIDALAREIDAALG